MTPYNRGYPYDSLYYRVQLGILWKMGKKGLIVGAFWMANGNIEIEISF